MTFLVDQPSDYPGISLQSLAFFMQPPQKSTMLSIEPQHRHRRTGVPSEFSRKDKNNVALSEKKTPQTT